jgi:hypothetical protein
MIYRPGGHLPNPAFVAGGGENPPAMIPYLGIMVPQQAETQPSVDGIHHLVSYQDQQDNEHSWNEFNICPAPQGTEDRGECTVHG